MSGQHFKVKNKINKTRTYIRWSSCKESYFQCLVDGSGRNWVTNTQPNKPNIQAKTEPPFALSMPITFVIGMTQNIHRQKVQPSKDQNQFILPVVIIFPIKWNIDNICIKTVLECNKRKL